MATCRRGGRQGDRLGRQQKGVVAVEFALVLPILLLILFSIIEFGLLFKDQLIIQQAAREGARTAAVGRVPSEVAARIQSAATTLIAANLTYDIMYRVYTGSAWSTWYTLGTNEAGTANDAPQGAQVRVRVNYVHPFVTGALFAPAFGRPGQTTMTLHAEMVMRRE